MKPLLFLLFLFALFFVAIVMQAQTVYGGLEGCVTDSTGEAIPGVRIEVVGTRRGAISRPDGAYRIVGLQAGLYTLTFTSLGKFILEKRVSIDADMALCVDAILFEDWSDNDTIVVKATRPPVLNGIPSTCTFDYAYSDEPEPISTSITDAILRDASLPGEGGCFEVRGCRGNELIYRIDGVEVARVKTGEEICIPALIDEYRLRKASDDLNSTPSIE